MNINKIKASISMIKNINNNDLNRMILEEGIDDKISIPNTKESVKSSVFNILN